MANLFEREKILDVGPHEFRRCVQRLLVLLGWKCYSVDGPGDKGGDLYCEHPDRGVGVIQCKWKKSGMASDSVVEEIKQARYNYNANFAIIATNTDLNAKGYKKLQHLASPDEFDVWNHDKLCEYYDQAPEELPKKELRPYQQVALDACERDIADRSKTLLYLATGLGKTVVAGRVLDNYLRRNPGAKVLILAHTTDLIEQLQRAMWTEVPKSIPTQLIDSNNKPNDLSGITISTNKSIVPYLENGYLPDFVFVDECHHVGGDNTYTTILDMLESSALIGVTATPWRSDKFSIEAVFGSVSYKCGIEEGMKEGYLSPVRYKLFCDNIDWGIVPSISDNSYSIKQLNKKLFLPVRDESIVDELLDSWHSISDPKCILFCQSIQHAKCIHKLVVKHDIWRKSKLLHSDMNLQERRMSLIEFRDQDCPMLIAVDILNEGIDVPDVNLVCFARVTHSRKIFVQQLGRGLRVAENKSEVVVLDFAADTRRVAAISNLSGAVSAGSPVESLDYQHNMISFSDQRAKELIDEWINDAADLETMSDEHRLQFPQDDP